MRAFGSVAPLSVLKFSITNSWCSAVCGAGGCGAAAGASATTAVSAARSGERIIMLEPSSQRRESNTQSMPSVRLVRSLVASLVTVLAAAACSNSSGQPAAAGPPAMPPTPVELAVAKPAPIEDATEYVATLKSLQSTAVQPQVDGQITQIEVVSGQRVARGAPLMQIDAQRQRAAVSSEEAELAAREASVAFARQQAQRSSELFTAGAISKQEQEQAATALQTAEANLKALQAQVQQQQVQLRYFTVAAPTSGIVGDVPVRVGNVVT